MDKINTTLMVLIAILFVGCAPNAVDSQSNEIETENTMEEISQEVQTESINDEIANTVEDEMMDESSDIDSGMKLFENSYRDFSQEEYELALDSDLFVVLDFYSNWCPSCNTEDSLLKSSFNDLENIVIFKVNYEDSDVTPDEEAIADEFDISNRASGIVLKNGIEFSRYSGHKNQAEYEELFNSLQ